MGWDEVDAGFVVNRGPWWRAGGLLGLVLYPVIGMVVMLLLAWLILLVVEVVCCSGLEMFEIKLEDDRCIARLV